MVAKSQDLATTPDGPAGEVVAYDPHAVDWRNVPYSEAFSVIPEIFDAEEFIGDGFELLKDKDQALGNEFLIIDWRFQVDKETNREYASMRIMTPLNALYRINDGSTGIYAQLKQFTERGITGGVRSHGLRKSEYMHDNGDGTQTKARTYYLT